MLISDVKLAEQGAGKKADPRTERTLDALQAAFMALMREKNGFNTITVADITARAGINRATFYAHFEDKYALLNYVLRRMLDKALDERIPLALRRYPEGLRLLLIVTCTFIDDLLSGCGAATRHTSGTLFAVQVQKYLQELLTQWLEGVPVDQPQIVALTLSWAIFGAALEYAKGKTGLTPEALADSVLGPASMLRLALAPCDGLAPA
jgi:AcrR family transcriptional regulator